MTVLSSTFFRETLKVQNQNDSKDIMAGYLAEKYLVFTFQKEKSGQSEGLLLSPSDQD